MASSEDDGALRMEKYAELLTTAVDTGGKDAVLAALKHMRRTKIMDATNCLKLTTQVVSGPLRSSLGLDDFLAVCEQQVEAALQVRDIEFAMDAFQAVAAEFPPGSSQRCGRLLCMILEAGGDLDTAEEKYKTMLTKNKANALLRKRLVCVAKARGEADKAVQLLNEYLKDFAGDFSGWLELAEMHESAARWEYATYCYEEVVLLKPGEPFPQVKVAECILQQVAEEGSTVRKSSDAAAGAALQARKHAAFAVHLSNSTYPRALWTLAAACVAVAQTRRGRLADAVPAGALEGLAVGAQPAAPAAPAEEGWAALVGSMLGGGATAPVLPADQVAEDDNAALFQSAVNGLQELYASTGEGAAGTYGRLSALQVACTAANYDGALVGSWATAAGVLTTWAAALAP